MLVEDDPSDAQLAQLALNATKIPYNLSKVTNGNNLLPFLRQEGRFGAQPKPDVIFLGLSLPCTDGFELLAECAEHPEFKSIPIIILTGQAHYDYMVDAYDLWLPAYLNKPCNVDKVKDALKTIRHPKTELSLVRQ